MTGNAENEAPQAAPPSRADDAALELMKQLITLAAGVLALSATFIAKLQKPITCVLLLLAASWLALLISVFFGLETISAIVQSRNPPVDDKWKRGWGRTSALISKYGFVIGITLFALFAFLSLATAVPTRDDSHQINIVNFK